MATDYDVVVVGAGNAALTAALSARERGASVLVLEKAPKEARGGNTRYTGGGYRFCHNGTEEVLRLVPDLTQAEKDALVADKYTPDDFYGDLMRVTRGRSDPELAEILVNQSNSMVWWLTELQMKWELFTEVAILHDGKVHFHAGVAVCSKGGGEGLVDQLFELAEKMGATISYEAKAVKLLTDKNGRVMGVTVKGTDGYKDIYTKAVVLACGGFEANSEMRTKYLGQVWDLVKVRGTRYDTGDGLKMAFEIGAQPYGQWSGCHTSIIAAEAPPYEVGTQGSRYSYLFGIIVNQNGERFVDEGEDLELYTYAKMGRTIINQPSGISYQIFDSKVKPLLRPLYNLSTPIVSDTVEGLAEQLGINPQQLRKTIDEFNRSASGKEFNPAIRDGKCTQGIAPPKSNWAQPLDTPPFVAYAVAGGITFTFGGVKINTKAQVLDNEGKEIPGLYATGEITGGIFYYNYPGASGLTRGAVFGRIAGQYAASE